MSRLIRSTTLSIGIIAAGFVSAPNVYSAPVGSVVINEVAWAGTKASSSDEWIELYNTTSELISLDGWVIYEGGGAANIIALSGSIGPGAFYLVERTDDTAVSDIQADAAGPFGGSGLGNSGEHLVLKDGQGDSIDAVNASAGWFAGTASPDYFTMERIDPRGDGSNPVNWASNNGVVRNGKDVAGSSINGTPKAQNSAIASPPQGEESSPPQEEVPPPEEESEPVLPGNAAALLVLQANAGPDIISVAGTEITFDASESVVSQGIEATFSWNFGDGMSAAGKMVSRAYKFPGTYIVTLTVEAGTAESLDQLTVTIYPAGIHISELLPSPEGSDDEGEWVELVNESEIAVNLGGWQLAGVKTSKTKPFIVPDRTFILPKGYLVLPRTVTKLTLANDSGTLRLLYQSGNEADIVTWEKAPEGRSAARLGDSFFWSQYPTPGTANVIVEPAAQKTSTTSPGESVVSENTSNRQLSQAAFYTPSLRTVHMRGDGTLAILPRIPEAVVAFFAPEEVKAEELPSAEQHANAQEASPNANTLKAAAAPAVFSLPALFRRNGVTAALVLLASLAAGFGFVVLRRKLRGSP